jgi:uncharacterized protein YutE (UPF0331/DUF86 family)
MVDEERVLRLLRSVSDDVSVLRREAGASAGLARAMRQAVGFRNVLVHDYIRVDDEIVRDRLKALGDLEDFVSQVASFIARA